jgi:hypothetical protein
MGCNQTTGTSLWDATRSENRSTKRADPESLRAKKKLCAGHQTTWLLWPMTPTIRKGLLPTASMVQETAGTKRAHDA